MYDARYNLIAEGDGGPPPISKSPWIGNPLLTQQSTAFSWTVCNLSAIRSLMAEQPSCLITNDHVNSLNDRRLLVFSYKEIYDLIAGCRTDVFYKEAQEASLPQGRRRG
jgi:hypothetical protein